VRADEREFSRDLTEEQRVDRDWEREQRAETRYRREIYAEPLGIDAETGCTEREMEEAA